MKLSYEQLVEHFETLKNEGWDKEACLEGGLELDSDVYIDAGDDKRAVNEVFGDK